MSSKKERVGQHEIGAMILQVLREYGVPRYKHDRIATLITRDFKVNCIASDVTRYESLQVTDEYEYESQKQEYNGFQDKFGEVF
jgi:hypothetical protein|tara:strand:+ start:2525 stop:2776 length:252 start_codon:yes stop_codon:yes gene_type:complete